MKKASTIIFLALASILVAACDPLGTTSDETSSEIGTSSSEDSFLLHDVSALLSTENLQSHIQYLASPELGGRASGSAENQLACEYVAGKFAEYGLVKYSEETDYFQPYLQPYTRVFTDYFSFEISNAAATSSAFYRYSHDFVFYIDYLSSYGYAMSPAAFDGMGELVSFSTTAMNYDDKFVLVDNLTSTILNDVVADGGKGIIVFDNADAFPALEYGQGEYLGEADFLLLSASPNAYSALEINVANGLNQVDVSYAVDTSAKTVNNVVGILDNGAATSIIVSSHVDHVGKFDEEDRGYFAGALDNASGTAAMLELARIYSENAEKLTKNYIFIAYNGEEAGLYGSQYYSDNMVGEQAATRAAFNLDMLGGGSDDYELEIIGYFGNLQSAVENKCGEYGIANYVLSGNQANSDHYWLGELKIPSLSFVHYDDRFYHTVNDTYDKIDFAILENQLSMIASLMLSKYNV